MIIKMLLTALISSLIAAPLTAVAEPPVWGITNVAPWGGEVENSETPSISGAIVQEISRRVGIEFRIEPLPYARLLRRIEADTIDIALSFRRQDAEAFSAYPACLFRLPIVAYARKGLTLRQYEDLARLTGGIGVIRGVTYGERFDQDPAVPRSVETDFPPMLRKLAAGRLDGVAGSTVMLMHYAQQTDVTGLLGDRLLLTLTEVCLQVPKVRADVPLTRAVVTAVQAMVAEGWAEALITRRIGQGWE